MDGVDGVDWKDLSRTRIVHTVHPVHAVHTVHHFTGAPQRGIKEVAPHPRRLLLQRRQAGVGAEPVLLEEGLKVFARFFSPAFQETA